MAAFDTLFAPYVPFGSRTLTVGDSGTDVALVQAVYNLMLATMNPPQGPMGNPIPLTGTFDANSRTAVMNIQSYFGITADGVVGAETYFVFGQGVGPNTTYGGPVYDSRDLGPGSSGGDVIILQNRLNVFRYASILGGPATGSFGAATANAVLAFKTDAALNGDTGFPSNPFAGFGYYDASFLYTFAGGRAIFTGRNGFDVVFLQSVLGAFGLYSGRLTGYYDTATQSAVETFQSSHGLTADGIVGPATFYQIGLENQKPAPAPLGVAWPPKVSPVVSVCSTPLLTQNGDLHLYGEATLVVNESEGFESLDVIGNLLPDPSTFGASFGAYAFVLTQPNSTSVYGQALMTELPTAGDWGGSLSPGVVTLPKGTVTVYPTPAGSATGPYGPPVLGGSLANCH